MPTTHEQLQRYLDEPEGTNFDFKEAKQHYHFEHLADYCVALANEVRSPKLKALRFLLEP